MNEAKAATTCNVDDSERQATCMTPLLKLLKCSPFTRRHFLRNYELDMKIKVQLANEKQLVDHYSSKHPKEKPPACKWGFVLSVFLFHLHDDYMSSVSFALKFSFPPKLSIKKLVDHVGVQNNRKFLNIFLYCIAC
uniref:Uncharacterized protein n=1 Tax=Lactuca sativa TaxID=4236 RepID=A0A9R1W697_LACSA|nr:hypothetical protein LSAT_V11C300135460 [Lactuca sativa]